MKRLFLAAVLAASTALGLMGCDSTSQAAQAISAVPANAPLSLELLAEHANGFTVGQQMASRTVYVFFDMQCPHCGELWNSAKPLLATTKFVWIPVGVLNRASIAQGATILASKDPMAAMNEHETSLTARRGGMSADSDAMDKFGAKIRANTDLLTKFKGDSVPFIVAKDPQTGALIMQAGAMPTSDLRMLLKM